MCKNKPAHLFLVAKQAIAAKLLCLLDKAHIFIIVQQEQIKTLILNVTFSGVVREASVKYSDS